MNCEKYNKNNNNNNNCSNSNHYCIMKTRTVNQKSTSNMHRLNTYDQLALKLAVLVTSIILISTCTCSPTSAQDINTNTVFPSEKELRQLSYPPVVSSASASSSKSKTTHTSTKSVSKPAVGLKQAAAAVIEYICPRHDLAGFAVIFSIPCKTSKECSFLGQDQRCCKRICRKGVPAPPKEPKHRAVLGVKRVCPKEPIPEILPVTSCRSDIDCEGENRVCCPDKDYKLYCRTAAPVWSDLPFPLTHAPLMSIIEYMQCQTAPPPLLDLFPQSCNRTIECLPNLCCQEGPNKFCRPPKKSVLSLVAQATQRFARG